MDPALSAKLSRLPRLSLANGLKAAVPCKVCGRAAAFYDVVDFNKSAGGYIFGPSDIHLPWYRCGHCGFLFTPFCDDWSPEDFGRFIYNEDYATVDPDHVAGRPRGMAEFLAPVLSGYEDSRVLDYGGGNGVFAARMKELGFAKVESYDPFFLPTRPTGRFDIVTCIEVIEHSPTPTAMLADIHSFLAEDGCVILGESMQPPEIDRIRCGWWYVAPRNGHVSTFAPRTLAVLAERAGMHFHRGDYFHMFRAGTRFAELAGRFGPAFAYVCLTAPGKANVGGFGEVEEELPGRRFQWTAEPEISWTIDVSDADPRVQIMIPFMHECRPGFAASCTLEVNGDPVPTSVQDQAIWAETEPLRGGEAIVTFRNAPLAQSGHRMIGLAIRTAGQA